MNLKLKAWTSLAERSFSKHSRMQRSKRRILAKNYSTAKDLRVDNSTGYHEHALLKFAVAGVGTGKITAAKLHLYCTDGSKSGAEIYSVDAAWDGKAVTWQSAPALGAKVGSLAAVAAGNVYTVDVTAAIKGDGIYSFRLTNTSADKAVYNSVESASHQPSLELAVESVTPSPVPSPSPDSTTQWASQVLAFSSEYSTSRYGSMEALVSRTSLYSATTARHGRPRKWTAAANP